MRVCASAKPEDPPHLVEAANRHLPGTGAYRALYVAPGQSYSSMNAMSNSISMPFLGLCARMVDNRR